MTEQERILFDRIDRRLQAIYEHGRYTSETQRAVRECQDDLQKLQRLRVER